MEKSLNKRSQAWASLLVLWSLAIPEGEKRKKWCLENMERMKWEPQEKDHCDANILHFFNQVKQFIRISLSQLLIESHQSSILVNTMACQFPVPSESYLALVLFILPLPPPEEPSSLIDFLRFFLNLFQHFFKYVFRQKSSSQEQSSGTAVPAS